MGEQPAGPEAARRDKHQDDPEGTAAIHGRRLAGGRCRPACVATGGARADAAGEALALSARRRTAPHSAGFGPMPAPSVGSRDRLHLRA
jgi:hypothetical protein